MSRVSTKVEKELEKTDKRFSFADLKGPSNALAMIACAGMAMMTLGCSEKEIHSASPEWISENPSLLVGKELVTSGEVKFLEDRSYIFHHNGYTTIVPCGKAFIPIYHPSWDENVTCMWYQISSRAARADSNPLLILSSRALEATTWKVQGEIKESKSVNGHPTTYYLDISQSWFSAAENNQ